MYGVVQSINTDASALGEQASVCLNLTEELVLTASKILPRFAVIKVMNNRMQTRTRAQAQYRQVS